MPESRTIGQARYIAAVKEHDITFCVGPAGTGKTFVATAIAVEALLRKDVKRIILTRPAVEAGEKLGYLPGDLKQKISPYLRPLFDCLHAVMEVQTVAKLIENDTIEIASLAFMRGRTLDNAFIILDEGQNTTVPQMKMFLTRMGKRSKVVVTGDATQIDLPYHVPSGFVDALKRLQNIRGLGIVELDRSDIVRHPLVSAIVAAYETPQTPTTGEPGERSYA